MEKPQRQSRLRRTWKELQGRAPHQTRPAATAEQVSLAERVLSRLSKRKGGGMNSRTERAKVDFWHLYQEVAMTSRAQHRISRACRATLAVISSAWVGAGQKSVPSAYLVFPDKARVQRICSALRTFGGCAERFPTKRSSLGTCAFLPWYTPARFPRRQNDRTLCLRRHSWRRRGAQERPSVHPRSIGR